MTFDEAVEYYHSLGRFGVRPGLERMKMLLNVLGNPQDSLKCIHVAGTNGKGTTSTLIAGILSEQGYITGLYTSPYVLEFRERIKTGCGMIPRDELVKYTETVKKAVEGLAEKNIVITEFEAVTAAAFLYYKELGCDYVVLEVGLGGRFDATNVIKEPLCSIITSVSMDHTGVLGDTLQKIAFEKSGIIKKGCPVVTSENQPSEVFDVISSVADVTGSELSVASNKSFRVLNSRINGSLVQYGELSFLIPFAGEHQIENASLALQCIEILKKRGIKISDFAVISGIQNAFIPARIEILSEKPLVILDGSHNDGSTRALSKVLNDYLPGKNILAVMGMMADKDIDRALDNLLPCFSEVFTVTPSNPRAIQSAEFSDKILLKNKKSIHFNSMKEACDTAFEKINNYDALVVCGSLYLAADIRDYLINKLKPED